MQKFITRRKPKKSITIFRIRRTARNYALNGRVNCIIDSYGYGEYLLQSGLD